MRCAIRQVKHAVSHRLMFDEGRSGCSIKKTTWWSAECWSWSWTMELINVENVQPTGNQSVFRCHGQTSRITFDCCIIHILREEMLRGQIARVSLLCADAVVYFNPFSATCDDYIWTRQKSMWAGRRRKPICSRSSFSHWCAFIHTFVVHTGTGYFAIYAEIRAMNSFQGQWRRSIIHNR